VPPEANGTYFEVAAVEYISTPSELAQQLTAVHETIELDSMRDVAHTVRFEWHVKLLNRGVATGVYRYIYHHPLPPKSVYLNFLCGCFVSLTQDKFDIVQFIPTQIKFLATPLLLN